MKIKRIRLLAIEPKDKSMNKFFKFFSDAWKTVEAKYLSGVEHNQTAAAKLAIKDATLLVMAWIGGQINTEGDNLDYNNTIEKFVNTVLGRDPNKFVSKFDAELTINDSPTSPQKVNQTSVILSNDNEQNNQQDLTKEKVKKNCCCQVFTISKIEYDSVLLNNPKLIKEIANNLGIGVTKVINAGFYLEEIFGSRDFALVCSDSALIGEVMEQVL